MSNLIGQMHIILLHFFQDQTLWHLMLLFFPFVLVIEWPFYMLVIAAVLHTYLVDIFSRKEKIPYYPSVSCLIICYSEGEAIKNTLQSLMEQLYRGKIELLVLVDDAKVNHDTVASVQKFMQSHPSTPAREIRLINKSTRGGRASSVNLGLKLSTCELILVLDGDTSCDNDLIAMASYDFLNPNVIGVSGPLRVRNARENFVTRLQAIEYMFGIQLSRIGLAKLGMINNISGAYGVFRRDFVHKIGGWKNGTAEDLDMTMRIKAYFKRYPHLKLTHNPHAIAHTDVPNSWFGLLQQRLRWDGDLFYIYCRRHWRFFQPRLLGWKNFIGLVWYGFLFQMVLPFSIILYMVYLFTGYSLAYALVIFLITYVYYFSVASLFFTIYWILISERKKYDLPFVWLIPLMPIYQMIIRFWSAVAILYEIIMQTHKDSSMAPWWVIRKTH